MVKQKDAMGLAIQSMRVNGVKTKNRKRMKKKGRSTTTTDTTWVTCGMNYAVSC